MNYKRECQSPHLPEICCLEANNVSPISPGFSVYHLKYNILLQIKTQMDCKCVPICNNLLQIGTQLQGKCVPICNNLLQIGTHLHCMRSIVGYLRLPQPTPAPALMRELH